MSIPSPAAAKPPLATLAPAAAGHGSHPPQSKGDLAKFALGALGVVYGDIGTSPLYAIKECVTLPHGVGPGTENVLGILSLVFWSITFVVSVKYLIFVLRADNNGEGGVLALMALVSPRLHKGERETKVKRALILLGLFGAALLYGDGMITPAISVLSAVEGLEVATTAFSPYVVPITCIILVALFLVQRQGTAGIGAVFGPTMLIWFSALAIAGFPPLVRHPEVLVAINPIHAVRFFINHRMHGFLVLGSVVLCITGGEALYADMGHFGRSPIRIAWYSMVFPCLLVNYFGQGAILLERPEAAANPFFALVEGPWLYPMVIIATIATVVASQALISGAFSMTSQAVQLGYSPRVTIVHTSGKTEGQIYIPEVNNILMVSCIALVLAFGSSSKLAAAYGIAVTGTMAITSVLFYFVARERWGWRRRSAGALLFFFLAFDLSFFAANIAKIANGGWFPLAVAAAGFTVMTTWKHGRAMLSARIVEQMLPLKDFLVDLQYAKPYRVPGTAVFLSSNRRGTPNVLLHHFKHNKVLHEQIVILSIVTDNIPEVPPERRIRFKDFGLGFAAVTAHFGFMESPDVPELLRKCRPQGLNIDEATTSYFLGRETLIAGPRNEMTQWRKRLFGFLSRNARSATDFFRIPPNRVVEIGTQIEL